MFSSYDATARTCKIDDFAGNVGLFGLHIGLMRFMPLLVANMYPKLYERARESIANMSRANYFYVIAYPEYSGFRVEHDPVFMVYLDTSAVWTGGSFPVGLFVIVAVIVVVAVAALVVLKIRKKPERTDEPPQEQAPAESPSN